MNRLDQIKLELDGVGKDLDELIEAALALAGELPRPQEEFGLEDPPEFRVAA